MPTALSLISPETLLTSSKKLSIQHLRGKVKFLTGSKVCEAQKRPIRWNSVTDGIVRMKEDMRKQPRRKTRPVGLFQIQAYPQDRSIMNRTVTMQQPKRAAALNIRTITMTALLSAMAYVLAFVEFPVPLSPSFAKMDLSDFPALIGAFAFGPLSGLLIELVKNALQLLTTSTGGIGEIANFLMGASYVVAAGVLYKHRKTKKTALLACVAASLVMGIAAALANYFILLPLFETFMPLDQLIASFGAFLPFIHTKLDIVLFNALPFNILKGLVIGGFTMLTYKRLTPILKGR